MTTFKKLSLISSVFFLFYFGEIAVNIACGGEADPFDYYITYFHNNIQGDEYAPFAFNKMVSLYDDQEVKAESDVNSEDWAKNLNVKAQDVKQVMYQTDSATEVKLSAFDGNLNVLPDSLKNNTFLQAMARKKDLLRYYQFAKACEPLANVAFDLWDPKPRDTAAMQNKAQEALKFVSSTKDDFLKLRYAYQSARMSHYGGDYPMCKSTYEQYIKTAKGNSPVKGWALALYAGAVRKTGNPGQSAYLFSKVFNANPERRNQAYRNYYYTDAPADAALKYAKGDAEIANIWAINGFGNYDYDLKSLNKVYQLEPKSVINGVLLLREVNKLEEALIKSSDIAKVSYSYYFEEGRSSKYNDSLKAANLKHLLATKDFSLKLAKEKKYPEPDLGYVTAAYLSWIENKPDQGTLYLSNIKNSEQLSTRLRDQVRIVKLLLESSKIKKGATFNENELVASLKWLDEKRFAENPVAPKSDYYDSWGNADKRFTLTTRNFYQQILAPAYMSLGDTAKAALAMVKGDLKYKTLSQNSLFKNMSYQTLSFWQRYLSPKSMQGLSNYKTKSGAEDMPGLLSKALNQLSNDDFYELYGTTYLRTHQYDKAVEMFSKISTNYQYFSPQNWYAGDDNKLFANPFIETIKDYPKNYASSKTATTKKTFAQQMLRLQKLTLSDKKNAAYYYYKMANAIYQTGYYGNSWFLISYDWSSYDNFSKPKYNYDVDYKKAQTAKAWYLKARALSNDPDFKAKCTFMLAKCAQKQIILNAYPLSFSWYDKDDVKFKDFITANYNNPYFKELRLKYKQTPFYQKASGECSYLGDFIGK